MNNRDIVPDHVKPVKRTNNGRVYACQHCDYTFHASNDRDLREVLWDHLFEQHGFVLKSIFMGAQTDVEPRKWAKAAKKAGAKEVEW